MNRGKYEILNDALTLLVKAREEGDVVYRSRLFVENGMAESQSHYLDLLEKNGLITITRQGTNGFFRVVQVTDRGVECQKLTERTVELLHSEG